MTARQLAVCLLAAAGAFAAARTPQSSAAAILLPPRLAVGQPATLAVLDGEGKLLAGAEVEFPVSGEPSGPPVRVTTDGTGRARFTAPAQSGVLIARLPGSGLRASALVLEAPPPSAPAPVVHAVAPLLALSDRFTVIGSGFSADADTNRVTLGGQPALVLAASPLALVVLPNPRADRGLVELTVEVGGRRSAPVSVTLVALEIASGKTQLARGERGVVEVRVRGTSQPVELEARNLTPETIGLAGGEVQRIRTSGGEDNRARIALSGRRGGEFALSVRLVPPAVGLPNLEALRQALLHAYRVAPPPWAVRTSRLLAQLREDPQNLSPLREEIERMLAERPPEEFARRLEVAWKILLGE
ncbi:MAG: IPT/TIG domain-containing protein [Acidobacteriia bacterium]|nr:IPT/TIG domain-containing protein [Terriglobia bacterium]